MLQTIGSQSEGQDPWVGGRATEQSHNKDKKYEDEYLSASAAQQWVVTETTVCELCRQISSDRMKLIHQDYTSRAEGEAW